ncbi:Na/Pi cotransporter family protein [Tritonibacter scottomollicae]|uniref:Na/Pi cotransporter family protein n=1 Tax=Tritonibacter scottomollicae TaxID=483013 RepID=A0ABZ0HIN8_TRISK|nr:Na/Pi cotransporter family protein [Tritonibacter scottomollicae]WOI33766.1 Na/Pi cotransporter family protein [Tritonibacter scottomollicae]
MTAFLIQIAGAAALLLWAVRLVRTGVERAFATQLRQGLRRASDNRVLAAVSGMLSAMLLQSSTAVAMLVSNFASKGVLTAAVGVAMLLGADLGSALVAQILLARPGVLVPALLLLGVVLFLRSNQRKLRQTGRILIGLALIFVSLDMLRTATAPIIQSEGAVAILGYLDSDLLTAFLLGAVFAWVVHSSVAAILLFVTMVAQGALPPMAAMAMVLGANLGGAMIAFVLTLAADVRARRIVTANLVLRGGGAIAVLLALSFQVFDPAWLGQDAAVQVMNLHLAFNLALCVLALPFAGLIAKLSEQMMRDQSTQTLGRGLSALDQAALEDPPRALNCAARELLRMGEVIEKMLVAAMGLYETWDDRVATAIQEDEKALRRMHLDLKLYLAGMNRHKLDDNAVNGAIEASLLAANLEAAADQVSRKMIELARKLSSEGICFSKSGKQEIGDFMDRIQANVQLALTVMMTRNPDDARELVAEKESIRTAEQRLQSKHLSRLREGVSESIETSAIHQETLRILKQVNTSFAMAGYPILDESGDLLSSRLSAQE